MCPQLTESAAHGRRGEGSRASLAGADGAGSLGSGDGRRGPVIRQRSGRGSGRRGPCDGLRAAGDISAVAYRYRVLAGPDNGGAPGGQAQGRWEINWDSVLTSSTATRSPAVNERAVPRAAEDDVVTSRVTQYPEGATDET